MATKRITVKKTAWGKSYHIGTERLMTDADHYYVAVQFDNGNYHRTRKIYNEQDADKLVHAIVNFTLKNNFPFTDKQGVRQWTEFDPNGLTF